MSESPVVKCMDCSSRAMLDRIPGKKSNKWVHRHCWPCAVAFYVATPAQLAVATLIGVPLGVEDGGKE